MKYDVEMACVGMMFLLSFMKTGSGIQVISGNSSTDYSVGTTDRDL
jgi:hypothetical protein